MITYMYTYMKTNQYQPPYSITPSMIHSIASIMEFIGQINIQNDSNLWVPEQRNHFHLQSIHATLAIENNRLSFHEVSKVISLNQKTELREEIEVLNARDLYEKIDVFDVASERDLLLAHKELMKNLIANAGDYRQQEIGVYQGDVVVFMAPPSKRVKELMSQLMGYLKDSNDHFLISSSVFHYEFEFIHPFSDGNGRMGRFWQKCILNQHHKVFSYLPIELMIQRHQQEYYDAISNSHQQGESSPFIEFMLSMIHQTLLEYMGLKVDRSSLTLKRLLEKMEVGVAYTPIELMSLVEIKSRSSFFNHYLKPALEAERVVRVFPDQPKNRNQQYIKLW